MNDNLTPAELLLKRQRWTRVNEKPLFQRVVWEAQRDNAAMLLGGELWKPVATSYGLANSLENQNRMAQEEGVPEFVSQFGHAETRTVELMLEATRQAITRLGGEPATLSAAEREQVEALIEPSEDIGH